MSKEPKKLLTQEEFDEEVKALELEERKLRLQTLRDDVDRKKMDAQNRLEVCRANGANLAEQIRTDLNFQTACSHRKGGTGMDGLNGRGNKPEYAVWKMTWLDGRLWIRCLRCGKTWKPPYRKAFDFDEFGKPRTKEEADAAFQKAEREYREASAFNTDNQPSGTIQFQFLTAEAKERFEEVMSGINLR